ncbi:MFS general substrate transporter [Punctularia strigosozonata HHB-11173 SS5]|uniref:MFS general substrate transporter n=1 Tax=Punctularia strigosozonata (strain HHB-11173) TaxID=741275 RepID=UPI00044167ED|nr:MFS general substrate transporter [Punctularia strigosozonata HHB-11173 SS5]EIN09349.1 MFS general substrate transporter [Punctularia strigosozonata HHB-11173 SS5]
MADSESTIPRTPASEVDDKASFSHDEHASHTGLAPGGRRQLAAKGKDAALEVIGEEAAPVLVTPEQNAAVLRKIDMWLMPVIATIYFLQQLDKSSLSYTSVFGIQEDAHLHGQQYSWLGSIVYVAQLVWQPVSSYLLVRLPVAKYLFVHVVFWGICVASCAAAKNFTGLLVARFFLGIFEATVAPCFITITQMWWRRREQTFRLAIWMAANGGTGMVGSLLAWGLGHINGSLRPYQVIFLFIGLLTIAISPIVLFVLPDSPTKARFLYKEEKIIAIERLRANNMGVETKVWKWEQVWELLLDPKTYLWFSMLFLCAAPSGGIGTFGPLIIKGFGFNQFHTLLFNIPFSAMQVVLTLLSADISQRIKLKWPVLFFLTLPTIGGASALLALGRGTELKNKLLGCYYVLSFFTAIQPMLYTWSSQNTAGHTKKLCTTGMIFVAQCAGNILGPQLYQSKDAPVYRRGLIANLACWVTLAVLVLITAAYLEFLNRRHARRRELAGKVGKVIDVSLEDDVRAHEIQQELHNRDGGEPSGLNARAFDDLTDTQNEDFIYAL